MLSLPPPPDFRYVRLTAGPRLSLGPWASMAFGVVGLATAALERLPLEIVALSAVMGGALGFALRRVGGPAAARAGATRANMALVPWGVLLEPDDGARVLHWAAIEEIDVRVLYGRDQETPLARWSIVTVRTAQERFAGRAPGSVAIEGLLANLGRYAAEQAHLVALDLEGNHAAGGPVEPSCAPLLEAASAFLASPAASSRLGLEPGGYRRGALSVMTPSAERALRQVLRDKVARPVDPRPFAAVVAALLNADALGDDVLALVQSPHPLVAAVARAAAERLGLPPVRHGSLDEVASFLLDHDVAVLRQFGSARGGQKGGVAA